MLAIVCQRNRLSGHFPSGAVHAVVAALVTVGTHRYADRTRAVAGQLSVCALCAGKNLGKNWDIGCIAESLRIYIAGFGLTIIPGKARSDPQRVPEKSWRVVSRKVLAYFSPTAFQPSSASCCWFSGLVGLPRKRNR